MSIYYLIFLHWNLQSVAAATSALQMQGTNYCRLFLQRSQVYTEVQAFSYVAGVSNRWTMGE